MVYRKPDTNSVKFTVQHAEVQDHRPQFGSAWGTCRLPVGHLTLDPVGTISAVDWRLGLWDAELVGTITTSAGQLALQVFIQDQVLVASVTPSGGEQVRWTFHPEPAVSPRAATEAPPAGYPNNPAHTTKTTGDVKQVLQKLDGRRPDRDGVPRGRRPEQRPAAALPDRRAQLPGQHRRGHLAEPGPDRISTPRCWPRTAPGGTRSTGRASSPSPTSGCRASTGSSSTRSPPAAARAGR